MSRILMVAVLGILVGLLAVMANIVNPKPAPPPTPAQQQQAQDVQKEAQKTALAREKDERKEMWKKRNEQLIKENPGAKLKPSKPGKPAEVQVPPSPMAMDISGDWYKATPDGEKGLAELAKIQKEREEIAKKAKPVNQPSPAPVLQRP